MESLLESEIPESDAWVCHSRPPAAGKSVFIITGFLGLRRNDGGGVNSSVARNDGGEKIPVLPAGPIW